MSTPDALLEKLSQLSNPANRPSVSILFIGFFKEHAASIQAVLRHVQMSPMCRFINDEKEFLSSLPERSWDLILSCDENAQAPTPIDISLHLKRLEKEIPVLALLHRIPDTAEYLALLKANTLPILAAKDPQIIIQYINRTLEQSKVKRELRHIENLLIKTEQRNQDLIAHSRTAIAYCQEGQLQYVNESFVELFGYDQLGSLKGLSLDRFITSADREALYTSLAQVEKGEFNQSELLVTALRPDHTEFRAQFTFFISAFQEATCLQLEVTLPFHSDQDVFAKEDPISGLHNDAFFLAELDKAINKAREGGHDCNLLYLSLDQYETILQEAGSEAADLMTHAVGKLLEEKINPAHCVAHLDNEAYGIIFSDASTEKATALARQLCLAIAEIEENFANISLRTTCSIGIASINETAPRVTEMLTRAKTAAASLHHAGRRGNGYSLHKLEHSGHLPESDHQAVRKLMDAISHNRFRLLFQPIVPLNTEDKACNYEILLRLLTDQDHEISPNIFLSSISDDSVMARMDMWVLEECILLLRQALDQGERNRLFINITSRTLKNKSLLPWLSEQLRNMRLPADHLVFQISETDALANPSHYKAFCRALKKLHCRICLKHYGSTSESEYLLKDTPLDYIKLDGNYMKDLSSGQITLKQLQRVLEPVQAQHISLIVPMVEDTRVMGKLFHLGVHLIQGHYLQPPRPKMDYAFFEH
ncbi:EAL domain-containing protein [Nitrincola tapanii]|uniref:GGDEF domain-containing protein n=1 Tax=Nitrincola tapanii TaxID=1708751 RepID=A0A5A9W8U3_9GAMM|nr:GGDEF domain-containing protein [Nitrincola tapanii]KAA0876548.1 GGDEF domain-containing protein [Nitrincola tapanii]